MKFQNGIFGNRHGVDEQRVASLMQEIIEDYGTFRCHWPQHMQVVDEAEMAPGAGGNLGGFKMQWIPAFLE